MRILVTGGCGFIGSNFIHHVLDKYENIRVINLDKLTYCANLENLRDIEMDRRYSFVKGDICDENIVKDLLSDIDIVVNFAAESHVDRSIKYPTDFLKTNVHGVKVLLEAARKSGVSKFIQIGTDEVYGNISEGFSREGDVLRPSSPYSATKAAADLLALSYYTTYAFPVLVTRSSNNFGPFQYPEKMIPLFITNLMKGDKVPLYGDGENVRDWIFVHDNCSAIDLILHQGKAGEIYNVGGGNHLSNRELTRQMLSVMKKNENCINFVNDRPGHDRRYALDSSKIKTLGWSPSSDFAKSLKGTVGWYKDNESWWTPLKEKAEIIQW